MLWRLAFVILLVVGVAACGGAPAAKRSAASAGAGVTRSSASSDGSGSYDAGTTAASGDDAGIEVPDATLSDAADAWYAMEDAGLTPTFADANQDISFDPDRDGTGCDVVDQDPAAGEMASGGDEVEITIDCAQVDWENQEGDAWEAFNDAYGSGFDDGCQELFDRSPDGSLYEDDDEYTAYDCQNLNPGDASEASDVPADVPDDPEGAGAELGELDGCEALFEQEGVYSLNWGEDSVTENDCPAGAISVTLPPAKHHHKPTASSAACAGRQSDGTPIRVRIDKGKVNCAGAVALWNEFLKRAPTEGAGSSGFLELDGWACAGALVTDKTHLGSCTRTDKTAEFTVVAD